MASEVKAPPRELWLTANRDGYLLGGDRDGFVDPVSQTDAKAHVAFLNEHPGSYHRHPYRAVRYRIVEEPE